jgi:phospholysine phosphohistidine inorganic pyrophosphate phosphatase
MANRIRAFLIDLDGVVYQDGRGIPGAVEAIDWLARSQLPFIFITNTTSQSRSALADMLGAMGIAVDLERILTPAVAASHWLATQIAGPVGLFVQPSAVTDFDGVEVASCATAAVSAVVIGDYGKHWDFNAFNQAFRWLMDPCQPPLLALGMTRYWQAADGLRLDAGPFVVALEYATGRRPVVLGKPALPYFKMALERLGIAADAACMIGDDILSDIGGARTAGIPGVLVRTGKFRTDDLQQPPTPIAVLDSIADLPDWWQQGAD